MKFRTQFDSKYKGEKGELNELDTMTKPDQNLSIQQLLQNHTRGIPSNVRHHEAVYTGEEEAKVFRDITEQQAYVEELRERKKKLDHEINQEVKSIKQKSELPELEEKLEEIVPKPEEKKPSKTTKDKP